MGDAYNLAIEASTSALTRTQTVRQVQAAHAVMKGLDLETLDCYFDEINEPKDESVPQSDENGQSKLHCKQHQHHCEKN